jgi:hypothetical protein
MQIFIQDDRAYQHWVTHHRQGFVIDGRRRSGWRDLVLHRATCPHVRSRVDRRTHWTTAGKFKACALNPQELQLWAEEDTGEHAGLCSECRPLVEAKAEEHAISLTRLAADVFDYILESAAIHLENDYPPYRLCVADIAACFNKTPGQLASALEQLTAEGLVEVERRFGHALDSRQKVYPTIEGLRTLSFYQDCDSSGLATELAKLRPVLQQHDP